MVLSVKDFAASLKGMNSAQLAELSAALKSGLVEKPSNVPVKDTVVKSTVSPEVVSKPQAMKEVKMTSKLDVDYSKAVDLFDVIYSRIIESEGGKANDKSDLGGPTMYGMASKYHPELAPKILAGTLTLKEAKDYTRRLYFENQPYVTEIDPGLAYLVVDAEFHGNREVIEQLQLGYNKLLSVKYGSVLKADGDYGSVTGRAWALINGEEARKLIEFYGGRKSQVAREAADRVIAGQKAAGKPVKDYFDGYLKRNEDRYANAIEIREQVA